MSFTMASPVISPRTAEVEEIYRAHSTRILKAAYRITGDLTDAEDVLQTVFLRLVRRPPDALAEVDQASYLYRAAINSSLDLLRMRHEDRNVSLADSEELPSVHPSYSPERTQDAGDVRTWLRLAMAKLAPRAAEMFALRYLEGADNREIARVTKTSQAVVAVTLFRTRSKLQKDYRIYARTK